jgi:molybdate transport system substrate-binding protein
MEGGFGMSKLVFYSALGCLLVGAMLGSEVLASEKLTVAAGAGYQKMVSELSQAFTAESGLAVELIFGNMGQVTSQAKNSGLVDCVIGDKRFLEQSALDFSSMSEIGRGRLLAAFAKGLKLESPADILRDDITRVAMPDPQKAIYGKAADEYLRNSNLYEKIKGKLLVVATVPQVSSYLISKEVDVGFVNLTDLAGIQDKIGGSLEIDQKFYSPILIVAGALKSAPNMNALKLFFEFLAQPKAKEIAAKHGL